VLNFLLECDEFERSVEGFKVHFVLEKIVILVIHLWNVVDLFDGLSQVLVEIHHLVIGLRDQRVEIGVVLLCLQLVKIKLCNILVKLTKEAKVIKRILKECRFGHFHLSFLLLLGILILVFLHFLNLLLTRSLLLFLLQFKLDCFCFFLLCLDLLFIGLLLMDFLVSLGILASSLKLFINALFAHLLH